MHHVVVVFFLFSFYRQRKHRLPDLDARVLLAFPDSCTHLWDGKGGWVGSLYRVSNGGVHCELVFSVSIITGNLFQHVRRLHTCSCQRCKSFAFLLEFSPPGLAHRRLKKAAVYCLKHQNVVDCLPGTEWLYTEEVATMCCIRLIYNWHQSVSWVQRSGFPAPRVSTDSDHIAQLSFLRITLKNCMENLTFIIILKSNFRLFFWSFGVLETDLVSDTW